MSETRGISHFVIDRLNERTKARENGGPWSATAPAAVAEVPRHEGIGRSRSPRALQDNPAHPAATSGRWDSNPPRPAWEEGRKTRRDLSTRQFPSEDVMPGALGAKRFALNSVSNRSGMGPFQMAFATKARCGDLKRGEGVVTDASRSSTSPGRRHHRRCG